MRNNNLMQASVALATLMASSAAIAPRAIIGVPRADAQDPKALLEALQRAHAEFADEVRAELGKKAGTTDVVTLDKIENLNNSIGTLQAALDEQATKVAALQLNGGGDDFVFGEIKRDPEHAPAMRNWMRSGDLEAEAKIKSIQAAITMGTPAEGGLLAPVEWDRSITDKLNIYSPIRRNSEVIQISGRGFTRVYNDGVIGSGWVGETAARPATTTPGLTTLQFDTGEIYANPAITQQALDDAAINLENWLSGQVDGEFARQENLAFLSGDGANKPFGILTYVTGAANAAKHPFGAIAVRNSATVGVLSALDLMRLIYDVPTERMTSESKFFMNRGTTAAMRVLVDANGNFIWQPSYAAGEPSTLAGYPVEEVPAMPAIATGNVPVLFGDMRQTYLVVDRIGIRVLRDPFTNKPYVHFYTTKRVGGGVQNPEFMRALKIA